MAGEGWDLLAAIAVEGWELAMQVRQRIEHSPVQGELPLSARSVEISTGGRPLPKESSSVQQQGAATASDFSDLPQQAKSFLPASATSNDLLASRW